MHRDTFQEIKSFNKNGHSQRGTWKLRQSSKNKGNSFLVESRGEPSRVYQMNGSSKPDLRL